MKTRPTFLCGASTPRRLSEPLPTRLLLGVSFNATTSLCTQPLCLLWAVSDSGKAKSAWGWAGEGRGEGSLPLAPPGALFPGGVVLYYPHETLGKRAQQDQDVVLCMLKRKQV